ncbi:Flp pilus assembly protein CpaB [Roseomonas elaeocarpi]|uniref:Flp pilus assembly protein CpaB n=1 Tax=Roseomonas elaeocarpi TaxID=907779 RepID=A0ABV6JS65_9PROT
MVLRLVAVVMLLLTAVGLGVVAFRAAQPAPVAEAAPPPPPPPPPPPQAKILVAARAIPAGTLLKDEDLREAEMAPEAVPAGAVSAGVAGEGATMRGTLLRQYREAGAPILRGDVLRPRDRGFLAAVLQPGRKAVSIGVDAVTGASGLIWPGDLVDVILVQELDAALAPVSRRVVAETVLTALRVIAVDQQIVQGATGDGAARPVARTVTLEVSAAEAERLAVAERLGRLTLAVRAMETPAGGEDAPRDAALSGADVSMALQRNTPVPGSRVRVIEGGQSQEVTFQ